MKQTKTIIRLVLAGFFLFAASACKEYSDLVPRISGTPGGGVTGTKVLAVNNDEITFEVNLFAVNHVGNFIANLHIDDFSATPVSGLTISIDNSDYVQQDYLGNYSVGLLFDQSGSINTTDPQDARVDAGKAFVDLMSKKDEMALAQFSGTGNEDQYQLLSSFTNDKKDLQTLIDNFSGNATGGTPLYSSMYEMIPYINQNAENGSNQALVAFTDGANTSNSINPADVITIALKEDIKVFTIGLDLSEYDALQSISLATGGAVMQADDALQLIALYQSLGELLEGTAYFYRTTWKAKKLNSNWYSGQSFSTSIKASLPSGETINLPLFVQVP